jgi:hypothetical protein
MVTRHASTVAAVRPWCLDIDVVSARVAMLTWIVYPATATRRRPASPPAAPCACRTTSALHARVRTPNYKTTCAVCRVHPCVADVLTSRLRCYVARHCPERVGDRHRLRRRGLSDARAALCGWAGLCHGRRLHVQRVLVGRVHLVLERAAGRRGERRAWAQR